MNEVLTKECIVCGNKFQYRTEPDRKSGRKLKNYRGKNMYTCSHKCSTRYNFIKNTIKYRLITQYILKHPQKYGLIKTDDVRKEINKRKGIWIKVLAKADNKERKEIVKVILSVLEELKNNFNKN